MVEAIQIGSRAGHCLLWVVKTLHCKRDSYDVVEKERLDYYMAKHRCALARASSDMPPSRARSTGSATKSNVARYSRKRRNPSAADPAESQQNLKAPQITGLVPKIFQQ